MSERDDELITVCAECHRSCCWNGYFMCDAAGHADTTELTRGALSMMDQESPHYWEEPFGNPAPPQTRRAARTVPGHE